jgi:hypothetical protein
MFGSWTSQASLVARRKAKRALKSSFPFSVTVARKFADAAIIVDGYGEKNNSSDQEITRGERVGMPAASRAAEVTAVVRGAFSLRPIANDVRHRSERLMAVSSLVSFYGRQKSGAGQ